MKRLTRCIEDDLCGQLYGTGFTRWHVQDVRGTPFCSLIRVDLKVYPQGFVAIVQNNKYVLKQKFTDDAGHNVRKDQLPVLALCLNRTEKHGNDQPDGCQ